MASNGVNNSAWSSLEKTGTHWWSATWDSTTSSDGKQILEIQAQDEADIILCSKKRIFWINNQPGFIPPVLKVSLTTDKEKYMVGEKMEKLILTVTVKDVNDKPVQNIPVDYAFYESRFWQSLHGAKPTDGNGKIEVEYYVNESGFINIGAGATLQLGEYTRKFGDVIAVEVEKIEKPKTPITPQVQAPTGQAESTEVKNEVTEEK
jgi:hypothetical protein